MELTLDHYHGFVQDYVDPNYTITINGCQSLEYL